MEYSEHFPSPRLRPFVDRYWSMSNQCSDDNILGETAIVDPGIEVFFSLGDGYTRYDADDPQPIPLRVTGSHIVGFRIRPIRIEQIGTARIFAIRFRPEGLASLMRCRASELTHAVIDARKLLGVECGSIEDRLFDAKNNEDRVRIVQHALWALAKSVEYESARHEGDADARVVAAVREGAGRRTVGDIADGLGIGFKRIERVFARSVGVPPKLYSRIVRFHDVGARFLAGEDAPWLDADYSDQSHFIRDFRQFTGQSPEQFRRASGRIGGWLLRGP